MGEPRPAIDDRDHWLGGIGRAIDRIEDAIGRSQELAVLMVYVDDVDRLCASAGHLRAGELLNDFRERLEELRREGDVVAQLSDRKFVLLLGGFRNEGHIRLAAQKIQRLIQESSGARTDEQGLDVSIGISLVAPPYHSAKEILRSVELALLEGRRSNEPVTFYKTRAADEMVAGWHLEQKFADALEAGNLELYYQPKMDLDSKRIVGAEALLRWHDPELGEISPDVFIGVAERSGLITELTYFAIQRGCRQLNDWKTEAGGLTVAINTTPNTTRDFGIIDVLESATRIWNVDPASIVIEVTENALMADPKMSHRVLTGIRDFGAQVSIDDFGTGYSSLAYLKEIPADELKIDRSFVMNMLSDPGDYKIVEHSTSLAKSLGLRVVAEGVMNAQMVNVLWALGCDYAQGYYICEPLPTADFLPWYLKRAGPVA